MHPENRDLLLGVDIGTGGLGPYDSLDRTYTELYPATREQVHRLAAMQESAADPLGVEP